ncbi:MAG: prolipoprotein diacylglyceryl transferase [Candidatus Sumerlaeaceae bacterium]|nr:prolipoprotein diacylglyceryl transferase [Candidatus Sumerlaeaceae bacterium]
MRPILFTLWGFPIPSYGVLTAIGILAATLMAALLARRARVSLDFVPDFVFWVVLAGFVGARLTYLLLNPQEFRSDPIGSLFSGGGGVFLGGLAGGILAGWWISRRWKVSVWLAADLFAPAVALGHAFGRIGCYLSGCCYGCLAKGIPALGVRYPRIDGADGNPIGAWAYMDHLNRGLMDATSHHSMPVYPIQLIEAFLNAGLCAALVMYWKRRRFDGQVAALYLSGYAILRFLTELFRGDDERGIFAGLSLSQWLSIAAFVAGLAILKRKSKQNPLSTS